jgi:ADP-ribose pyrophosphatase YjhB (NUDIX family)
VKLDTYLKENYKLCPRCGAPLSVDGDHLACPKCPFVYYYNPALAVALIAFNEGGEILLNRKKIEPHKNEWDTVGGFVDVGENAEEAAIREFKEETQADCEIVKYWGSSSDIYGENGIQTINLFFEVKITGGELKASDDAAELKFFALDDLPEKIAFQNTTNFINLIKKEQHVS